MGDFLAKAGVSNDSAKNFMGMFQMDFNPQEQIDDLPRYTHQLMQRLYQGYRDKIKNGVSVWMLDAASFDADAFSPYRFNKALNTPPRLMGN